MVKRLALFEFITLNEKEDFRTYVSNLVNSLKSLNEDISKLSKNIDIYAPEGVRVRLRAKANEAILRLANSLKHEPNLLAITPDINYLEELLYILAHFKSEVEVVTNIKAILSRAKQLFPNEDLLFKRATNIDRFSGTDFDQIIPSDPKAITPSDPSDEERVRAKAVALRRLGI